MKTYKKFTISIPKTEEICKDCKKDCTNDEGSTLIWCIDFKEKDAAALSRDELNMIENEQQYEITKTQLEKFRKAIDDLTSKSVLAKIELDALKSEAEVLSEQVQEYEANH